MLVSNLGHIWCKNHSNVVSIHLVVAFIFHHICHEINGLFQAMLLQQEVWYLQDGYTLLQCCSASLVLESTSPILHLEVPETMSIISNFYINHD